MDWLRENWFWLTVLVLFVVMHMGHGHGGHGGHGGHTGHKAHGDSHGDPADDELEGSAKARHDRTGGQHEQH